MRFLNISGPGVATDEGFCPNCHVLLDQGDDHKACPLCRYDARQHGQRRRIRRQHR
jgi:ribosomal protein S27AE